MIVVLSGMAILSVGLYAKMVKSCLPTIPALDDTPSPKKTPPAFLRKDPPPLLQKTAGGNNWQVWNRSSVLNQHNLEVTCHWVPFRPRYAPSDSNASICVFPTKDDNYVSGEISRTGRWRDCDGLTSLLQEKNHDDTNPVLVEIGANIGACIMQVLLSTDATIVAFEPDPRNLFVLTTTLMALPSETRSRVHLFPLALGASPGRSTIHVAANNRGNSIVSQSVKDQGQPGQQFLEPMPISIERLDDILAPDQNVAVMKMDAQGYECFILRGMENVLRHIDVLVFELESIFLDAFPDCSSQILWDQVKGAGFDMYSYDSLTEHSSKPLLQMPRKTVNLLARKADPNKPLVVIPRRMTFNYRHNILETKEPKQFYDNIQNTVTMYRRAWNEPNALINFDTDDECRAKIQAVEPRLVPFFDSEKTGMYRSDVCRIADLYQHGGWYFDNDLLAVEAVKLPPQISFMTVLEPDEYGNFFQALIACKPHHPVMQLALECMLDYYHQKKSGHLSHRYKRATGLGTSTLKAAYERYIASHPSAREEVRFLREVDLKAHPHLYPNFTQQSGGVGMCNWVVHDPEAQKVHFSARVVGSQWCR